MKVLLVIPPLIQANTPYSSTPLLTAFLRRHGYDAEQADASLQLLLTVFSRAGLAVLLDKLKRKYTARKTKPPATRHLLAQCDRYLNTIDPVISFLQGKDPSLAYRIAKRDFLPEGLRFTIHHDDHGADMSLLTRAFGDLSYLDRSRYLAGLYLDDITDGIREGLDPKFNLSRYGEHLAATAPDFTPFAKALLESGSPIDGMLDAITRTLYRTHKPDIIGFTIPFPGTLYGALRMAKEFRLQNRSLVVVAGGGYVSTEWRALNDKRLFDYFDHLVLDDGELPLLHLIRKYDKRRSRPRTPLVRTLSLNARTGTIERSVDEGLIVRHRHRPTPDYSGLALDKYFPVVEMLNPMHRLWADQRWNKLTLAHGCYWHRCRFCDTSLDYIQRYDPAPVKTIVDWIMRVKNETGQSGFHFTDEAAPPALLHHLSNELIKRRIAISWWTNIRFEQAFTPAIIERMAASGCIALSGGLETAESRTLKLLNKGIDLTTVARITHDMNCHGIMVHAYLMYGVPTQTLQETVDALEYVRQLFVHGCIQSAFWHRFALTVHSRFFAEPDLIGVIPLLPHASAFSINEMAYTPSSIEKDSDIGRSLHKAVYNFMHGVGLETAVSDWFGKDAPQPRLDPDVVECALNRR